VVCAELVAENCSEDKGEYRGIRGISIQWLLARAVMSSAVLFGNVLEMSEQHCGKIFINMWAAGVLQQEMQTGH